MFTIYKQKTVGTRFVQIVSKNSRMGNLVGIGVYDLQNSFKFEAKSWENAGIRFPFVNSIWEFWTTFQEIPFSLEKKGLPFTFQPKFPDFLVSGIGHFRVAVCLGFEVSLGAQLL